jgi:preprotein translocase subunit SecF
MKTLRLVPDNTKIDFMSIRHYAYALSIVMIVGAIVLVWVRGLNLGIDFEGGILLEVRTEGAADLSAMRSTLGALDFGEVSLQEFGSPNDILIRIPRQEGDEQAQLAAIEQIKTALGTGYDYRRTEFVGPQVGQELIEAGILAVLLSVLGITIYIWFRFEWRYGISAVICLVHDVVAVLGLFALTQMEFSLTTLSAVLLVAGYSVNDTVVISDRIRENVRKYKTMPIAQLINLSLNETLARTVMTGGTVLLALGSLWLFGGEVIRNFVDAVFIGIIIGTYSSIFVAAPILIIFNLRPGGGKPDAASSVPAKTAGSA